MKRSYLSIALSLVLATAVNAAPVFDGTTENMKPTSENNKIITVTDADNKKNNVEVLDVNKYFDFKYKKNKEGKITGLEFNQQKMNEMLKDIAPLKVGTMMSFQKDSKHMVLMSENQRFIFIGQLYDVFNGMRKISSVDEVRNYAMRLNYELMGIDPDEMNSVSIGHGKDKVVIWVAPTSPYTKKIMEEAIALAQSEDGGRYTFYFVVIPADTAESFDLTKRFMCAREEGNSKIGNLLLEDALDTLPKGDCPLSKAFEKTMVYKSLSDVDLVPFIVAPDGRVSRGMPSPNLKLFLLDDKPSKGLDVTDGEQKKLKVELEDQIVDRALDNEIDNLNQNTDYDVLSKTSTSFEDKQRESERAIADLKAQYTSKIQKYRDKLASENLTYSSAAQRVRDARNALSDNTRMDYAEKSRRIQEYEGRIQALDEKHNRKVDDYNKSIERLQKELQSRIYELTQSLDN
ncbi:MAG: hypothetical protein SPK70_03325 [Succinivibrio dextrinosolvens]|nr:hypothetical protein [Succinivibrio dextrinosolvens]